MSESHVRRFPMSQMREDVMNRAGRKSMLWSAAALATAVAVACGGGAPTPPSSGTLVTFAVGNETFRVALTTTDQVAAARAAQSGGPARIPIGRVLPGTQVNAGWNWHLDDDFYECDVLEMPVPPRGRRARWSPVRRWTVLPVERDCRSD